MRINFEYVSNLQYKVKALQAQVEAYESGEAYRRQKEEYEKRLREKDRIIASLKKELARSHAETITVRNQWMEVFEDLEKEHRKALSKEQQKNVRMEKRMISAQKGEDRWHEKWKEQQAVLYAVQTELEEEKEKNRKLTAQVNKDFENSSIPSSMQGAKRKKIPNSRVKTGRCRGGQPGHPGHPRRLQVPTETHEIPAPKEYTESPDYYKTGNVIRKQKVEIHLCVRVIEYITNEYRNRRTGARVYAPFVRKLMTSPVMNADFTNTNVNGGNAQVLMKEYKESELLFLHDKRVPSNNSLRERLARVFKSVVQQIKSNSISRFKNYQKWISGMPAAL